MTFTSCVVDVAGRGPRHRRRACARSLVAVCGIIADRQPDADAGNARAGRARRRAGPGAGAASVIRPQSPTPRPRSTPRCAGCRALLALADRHELVAAIGARLDQLDRYAEQVEAELAGEVARRRRTGTGERGVDPSPRRAVGDPPRSSADGARGRRPRRSRRVGVGTGRLPGDPTSVVGDRPDGGSRARLGRTARLRVEPRRSTSTTRRSPRRSPSDRVTVCSRPARSVSSPARPDRTRCCRSCTRRRPRSASSATTRRRCASRSPATISSGWRCRASGPRCPCSATRAGRAWGSSPSPTPTR